MDLLSATMLVSSTLRFALAANMPMPLSIIIQELKYCESIGFIMRTPEDVVQWALWQLSEHPAYIPDTGVTEITIEDGNIHVYSYWPRGIPRETAL
jgi:hypothetical protein